MSLFGVIRDKITGTSWNIGANGAGDVCVVDQITPSVDARLWQQTGTPTTLAVIPTIGEYTVTLTTGHGFIVGDNIGIADLATNARWMFGTITNVATDVITLDVPVNYEFPLTSLAFTSIENMAVDGSSTPQIFTVSNLFTTDVSVDLTRLIFHITDGTVMDDSKFGGLSALTNGIVIRKKKSDGTYENFINIKNNGQFGEWAYDKEYDDKAPSGLYGFRVRGTYAGEDKHGVSKNLTQGEAVEVIIQDDLTGLVNMICMAQGHFTE